MNLKEQVILFLDKNAARLKLGYAEIIAADSNGAAKSTAVKTFKEKIVFVPYSQIEKENIVDYKNNAALQKFTVKSDREIHCIILSVIKNDSLVYGILAESDQPFSDEALLLFEGAALTASAAAENSMVCVEQKEKEIKNELMNMRSMQAMLFPKFDDVKGIDAGAMYLPAKLMSGNFVDACYLNDEVYQITTCVVNGYDATSSFIGAAVRTLLKSTSSSGIIPSALLEMVTQKLAKIVTGVNALVNISVYQINSRNGRTSISSYGSVDTLYYIAQKKSAISLNETQIGKELIKRNVFKDISFIMDPGDAIMFYSKGVIDSETEDGTSVYGMQKLWDKFKTGIELTSLDHMQAITQDLFEYINFSPIKDDVILMRAKKL